MNIEEVLKKYFLDKENIKYIHYGNGVVNVTYKVDIGKRSYILQKMNKIIDPLVMDNIEAITKHLISKNILTLKVIKTIDGKLFLIDGMSWWRMFSYIPGISFTSIQSEKQAENMGKFLGEFHNALFDCNYDFKYNIPHFHDTDFDINNLKQTLSSNMKTEKYEKLKDMARYILEEYRKIKLDVDLPLRITHQDLKISNVIFDEDGKAIAFIDLDTLMKSNIAIELGDALRSWCMRGGEDTENPNFDKGIYDATLSGYFSTILFLTENEKKSISYGVKLIALGLSARWVTDAFNESYWKLDSSKYKSLFEQNKKRAENQLVFYKEFSKYKL